MSEFDREDPACNLCGFFVDEWLLLAPPLYSSKSLPSVVCRGCWLELLKRAKEGGWLEETADLQPADLQPILELQAP